MCSTSAHHKPSLEWARGGWVPHAQSNLGKPPLCMRALSGCSSQSLSKGQGRAAAAVLRCPELPAPLVPRPRPEAHPQSLHSRQHLEPDGPNYRPDQGPMCPLAFLIWKCCPAPEVIHLTWASEGPLAADVCSEGPRSSAWWEWRWDDEALS